MVYQRLVSLQENSMTSLTIAGLHPLEPLTPEEILAAFEGRETDW